MRTQPHTHTHTQFGPKRVFRSQNSLITLTLLNFTLSPLLEYKIYVKEKRKLGTEVYR